MTGTSSSASTTHKGADVSGTKTSTTFPIPRFDVTTSTSAVEGYVRTVLEKTIAATAADRSSIGAIMEIIGRADIAELRKVMNEDKEPPIVEPHLRRFWHVAIYTARMFLEFRICMERSNYIRHLFQKIDTDGINVVIGVAHFIRTRHGDKYWCVDRPKKEENEL